MLFSKKIQIKNFEIGLLFREGDFVEVLEPGTHKFFDPWDKIRVAIHSQRDAFLVDEQLDVIVKSGALAERAEVLDLKQHQRALVWVDGRFDRVLGPGLYAYWTKFRGIHVEAFDAREVRFEHAQLKSIWQNTTARQQLEFYDVNRDCAGVLFIDGRYVETLGPGAYAFWRGVADIKLVENDLRESMLDIRGQDIMTADKVTLRINAVATYKITDAKLAVTASTNVQQSLYREVQLALRSVIGSKELDPLLSAKETVAEELETIVRRRAGDLGLTIVSVGIRDVILPGEMKNLMNQVMEAKKAAEANLIARREEVAAMRSQANTAKMLADSPTLMRLRELEVLEKIAKAGKLNIVLGEKGLADRLTTML
ncbi:slipin family protein [Blastopirellula marina]|uniref:Peptidase n=1 Tax=Blastopirellula marina TaxID=124 RepID=A0A2S8G1V5_9BACT|nr:slipin family protein [Blastopirellula marina]PQO38429.1 peptidase [Blastopirellula marina]PTL45086.1 slipin family protein [Blastopirellula marina]